MCTYVCACLHACVYMYVHVYMHACVCVCVCVCVCEGVCICVGGGGSACVCTYTRTCPCTWHIRIYVHVLQKTIQEKQIRMLLTRNPKDRKLRNIMAQTTALIGKVYNSQFKHASRERHAGACVFLPALMQLEATQCVCRNCA